MKPSEHLDLFCQHLGANPEGLGYEWRLKAVEALAKAEAARNLGRIAMALENLASAQAVLAARS